LLVDGKVTPQNIGETLKLFALILAAACGLINGAQTTNGGKFCRTTPLLLANDLLSDA
jgi:hypothetical protein